VNWVPGDSKNLVRRLNGEFNLALGNELGGVHASYQFALFVHLFGDAQLVENTDKETPLTPLLLGAVQAVLFTSSNKRFNASAVLVSGFGASFLIPMPKSE